MSEIASRRTVWQRLGMLTAILAFSLFALVWVVQSAGQTAVDNDFVAYENNPVMTLGAPGQWDEGTIVLHEVVVVSDTYYLFYSGFAAPFETPASIGYATSSNGITWTRYISNPVLTASETGFDSFLTVDPAMLYEDGLWTMYYLGKSAPQVAPNDSDVGRAVASSPSGPWVKDINPVLTRGSAQEWDSGFVAASSVLKTEDGYVMYYSGGINFFSASGFMIGMATSTDGINWTKYDDPTTTEAPFAESDPVLMPGESGAWDSAMTWIANIRQTACGWEMYYTGARNLSEASIGYASSSDGIQWTKDAQNPIFVAADDPAGIIVEGPTVIDVGEERWMYYDYGQGTDPPVVGLAKAPLSCLSEASLALTVTLSTEETCGTAVSLLVPPGTTVYYCYTVTRTGDALLPQHTITDSVHGHIDTFLYDLLPDASASVIYSQSITADADSVVTWEASYPDFGLTTVATDAVTVEVETYGVTLSDNAAQAGDAGTTVTYTVDITNTGNVTDTFSVALSGQTWESTLSTSEVTLGAGEVASIAVTVGISDTAVGNDTDTVTVTATSQTDASATASTTLTTTALVTEFKLFLPLINAP